MLPRPETACSQRQTDLLRAAPCALFAFWLMAFPMEGPLLDGKAMMEWFLWPHVLGLLACTHRAISQRFHRFFIAGTLLMTAGTFAYAFLADGHGVLILLVLGAASAPFFVQALLWLRATSRPVLLGALCMTTGILGLLLLMLPFFFASPLAMEVLKHWFRKNRAR